MLTIIILDDETGENLRSSYETESNLCDALENNMPNLGRLIRRRGFHEAIEVVLQLVATAKSNGEWP